MKLLILLLLPLSLLAQRPNIVWISCEDTSPEFIGCYGNTETRTPNIDALAAIGTRFTNAFSTNVVCAPSRNCLITGVRTAESGNGYHRSQYRMPSYVTGFASLIRQAGYFTTNNVKTDYNLDKPQQFTNRQWDINSKQAGFLKRESKTQPFFAVFNFTESHQSKTMTFSYERYKREIESQLTPSEIIQPSAVTVPPFYLNSQDNRVNIARMYNSIQVMDKKVGEIVQMIKDAGEWDNTIVFYFGDHGEGMPRFKNNNAKLGAEIPLVIRVPEKYRSLLASGVNQEYVCFEDFGPTMLALVGLSKPSYMRGRVFMGKGKGADPRVHWITRDNTDEIIDMGRTVVDDDFIYERNFYPHLAALQRQAYGEAGDIMKQMRRDYAAGKLDSLQASLLQPRSAEYLYDRKKDPWETHNLAADPRYAKQLAAMRARNEAFMMKYKDIGFIPQTALAAIDARDTVMNWKKNYAFEKYLSVARTIGMGPYGLAIQLKGLLDKDSIVRYWSAQGLRNQSVKILPAALMRKAFAGETSSMVKIELAELLRYMGDAEGMKYLTALVLQDDNVYLVRQALLKMVNAPSLPSETQSALAANKARLIEKFKPPMGIYIKSALNTLTGQPESFDGD